MSSETVFVKILDKDYQVACPAGEKYALTEAARNLDERMRAIRNHGSVIGLERIAVMAALNLSHELLLASGRGGAPNISDSALTRLNEKLEQALNKLS
ncbi:cell division protein ZapA [Pseudomaricurvus sp. HS19]|uniref:cell division protein ZapA n=1 Tax=Pseudomaricurvus sp. HS19 TaxID=2692626 RepID=UPI00136C0F1E|nr:cell division protein ZapA [Pseudomaricurvus sp. HS19]MYM63643.1 cell division protein ZapA [Pseudomaricurvus sp. HS19]